MTNDILNLVNSTEIGTLFVDAETRIKLFMRIIRHLFSLIPSHLGRPLSDALEEFSTATT